MSNNISEKFPIIVLTRNEAAYLKRCIESIINTVTRDVKVYIIDNNSDEHEHLAILKELEEIYSEKVVVVRKKNNLWILGVNTVINEIKSKHTGDYFLLTDGDIDFSECKTESACWLSYLIDKMVANPVVGKLGFSLNWNFLKQTPELSNILKQEQSLYNENKKLGDLYISQVDTTATIFRWDWSMESSSKLYPDHMRYLRPELYSCRTPHSINVEHLGWYKYKKETLSQNVINSKVRCFTVMGAALKTEIVSQASFSNRVFFTSCSRMFSCFWIVRRYFILYRYIWNKGRRSFDGQG